MGLEGAGVGGKSWSPFLCYIFGHECLIKNILRGSAFLNLLPEWYDDEGREDTS